MVIQPTLDTPRLLLRPMNDADAPAVQPLVSAREIADTTLSIPHPYPEDGALDWIRQQQVARQNDKGVVWALVRRDDSLLLGACGLMLDLAHSHAEMGYWCGVPFWNRGYVTEAAGRILQFAFDELGLARVFAQHLARNPSSGRVMQKLGMRHEGTLRKHILKWGVLEDACVYGILREEFSAGAN